MQQNYYCKIKAIFILFLFLIVGAKSFATHIVGGFISYRYISGNTYELTLKAVSYTHLNFVVNLFL